MSVAARLAEVRERIDAAARAAHRDPAGVTLVVVTKEVTLDPIREALAAGATDLGENRAQELVPKALELATSAPAPHWHFIGRLQRNKVSALARHVELWQSVDRAELLDAIARHAPAATVLVQVNVAGEVQKGGCEPGAVRALIAHGEESGLRVRGLMTVPPLNADPRPHFAELRTLTETLGLEVCSMGMSGDYEVAIAEGSTMVRVGSAIFGPRPGPPAVRR
jgi:PLP dependent protein